jgi:hypothetical protein
MSNASIAGVPSWPSLSCLRAFALAADRALNSRPSRAGPRRASRRRTGSRCAGPSSDLPPRLRRRIDVRACIHGMAHIANFFLQPPQHSADGGVLQSPLQRYARGVRRYWAAGPDQLHHSVFAFAKIGRSLRHLSLLELSAVGANEARGGSGGDAGNGSSWAPSTGLFTLLSVAQ